MKTKKQKLIYPVRIKDNATTRAWGHAGKTGVVIGPDPSGDNDNVVAVRLDEGPSIFEFKGVNKSHLEDLVV